MPQIRSKVQEFQRSELKNIICSNKVSCYTVRIVETELGVNSKKAWTLSTFLQPFIWWSMRWFGKYLPGML